jgi:alpha-tubulin suppressor-like RCC1 family protein
LFANGRITCWGNSGYGIAGRDNYATISGTVNNLDYIYFSDAIPAMMIASFSRHACSLSVTGRVRCWGQNDSAQLGDTTYAHKGTGSGVNSMAQSVYVTFAPSINTIPITDISVGSYAYIFFFCLYCSSSSMVLVALIRSCNRTQIRIHSCAVFSNGRVICWGANSWGMIGVPWAQHQAVSSCGAATCIPVSSTGFISFSDNVTPAVQVTTGDSHTCGKSLF